MTSLLLPAPARHSLGPQAPAPVGFSAVSTELFCLCSRPPPPYNPTVLVLDRGTFVPRGDLAMCEIFLVFITMGWGVGLAAGFLGCR